ncbi:hypothetical protein BU15DRAFT_32663, partial [Melanogaster broomeanus]
MTLPKGQPTLQVSSSKNWTRPDNVFCTDHTSEAFSSCKVHPELRGPTTDHVPILSTLELEIPSATTENIRNYREVDWEKFKEKLKAELSPMYPIQPITTRTNFQNMALQLSTAIQNTVTETVPYTRPNPHSKRWWTHELTLLKRDLAAVTAESYSKRALPNHEIHEEFRKKRNSY